MFVSLKVTRKLSIFNRKDGDEWVFLQNNTKVHESILQKKHPDVPWHQNVHKVKNMSASIFYKKMDL